AGADRTTGVLQPPGGLLRAVHVQRRERAALHLRAQRQRHLFAVQRCLRPGDAVALGRGLHRRDHHPPGGGRRRPREPVVRPVMTTATTSLTRRSNRFAYVLIAPAPLCLAPSLAFPILYATFMSFRRAVVVRGCLGEGGRTARG